MKFLRTLFALVFFAAPAIADTIAHPALWHVKGPQGDVYLLGAVHILPPELTWRTAPITVAIGRADIFVFEVSQDADSMAKMQTLIQAHGFLPEGQTLRASLHPKALADFDNALAASGVAESAITRDRPWLAGLQMMFTQMRNKGFAVANGVDTQLLADARRGGKPVRYLETVEEQFALLAPDDTTVELEEFESSLKDLRDISAEIQPLVDAWSTDNQPKLNKLLNGDLEDFPAARKALLDDRNKRWLPQIERMMREGPTFFVTVGAGHLTGPHGLPTLLRKAGYSVDGP